LLFVARRKVERNGSSNNNNNMLGFSRREEGVAVGRG